MSLHNRLPYPDGSDELPDASSGGPPNAAPHRAAGPVSTLRRMYKRGGLLVAGVSGLSGVAIWGIPKHGSSTVIAVIGMVVLVAAAVTGMYRERQETRRTEIRHHPENTMAEALAGLLRAAHDVAPGGTPEQEATEAKRVRENARLVLTEHGEALMAELTKMKASHVSEAEDDDR